MKHLEVWEDGVSRVYDSEGVFQKKIIDSEHPEFISLMNVEKKVKWMKVAIALSVIAFSTALGVGIWYGIQTWNLNTQIADETHNKIQNEIKSNKLVNESNIIQIYKKAIKKEGSNVVNKDNLIDQVQNHETSITNLEGLTIGSGRLSETSLDKKYAPKTLVDNGRLSATSLDKKYAPKTLVDTGRLSQASLEGKYAQGKRTDFVLTTDYNKLVKDDNGRLTEAYLDNRYHQKVTSGKTNNWLQLTSTTTLENINLGGVVTKKMLFDQNYLTSTLVVSAINIDNSDVRLALDTKYHKKVTSGQTNNWLQLASTTTLENIDDGGVVTKKMLTDQNYLTSPLVVSAINTDDSDIKVALNSKYHQKATSHNANNWLNLDKNITLEDIDDGGVVTKRMLNKTNETHENQMKNAFQYMLYAKNASLLDRVNFFRKYPATGKQVVEGKIRALKWEHIGDYDYRIDTGNDLIPFRTLMAKYAPSTQIMDDADFWYIYDHLEDFIFEFTIGDNRGNLKYRVRTVQVKGSDWKKHPDAFNKSGWYFFANKRIVNDQYSFVLENSFKYYNHGNKNQKTGLFDESGHPILKGFKDDGLGLTIKGLHPSDRPGDWDRFTALRGFKIMIASP